MIYADKSAQAHPRDRRPNRPSYDPLARRAQLLENVVWERARKLADIIAPVEPVDEEPLSEHESWMLLERAAASVSPATWDDPNALSDLYRLRKMFMPDLASESLKIRARQVAKEKSMLPDPAITPENPEFEKRIARLKRSA